MDKLKENISGIFAGADIEPLLRGIHSLLSVFDQTSAGGKSLQAVIADFVNAAIGGLLRTAIAAVQMYIWIRKHQTAWQLVKAAVTAVAIVVGLLSAALLIAVAAIAATAAMLAAPFVLVWAAVVYLWGRLQAFWAWVSSLTWSSIGDAISATLTKAAQPVVQLWGRLQAFWAWVKSITWQDVGFAIGTSIGLAVLPVVRLWGGLKALWTLAKSITWADVGNAIGQAFDTATAPVLRIWTSVQSLWTQITSIDWSSIGTAITAPFEAAFAWLRSISLADIGVNMMLGLANGITSAASAVLSAITGVMSGAIAGAKAALGIASPSRLMRDEVGYQIGAGTAVGVDDSAAEVADSTKAMARGAVDAASPNGALVKGGVSSGAGTSFTFTNCAFGGDLTRDKLEEWLVGILHRNTLSAEPAT
jgi:phage-related protein